MAENAVVRDQTAETSRLLGVDQGRALAQRGYELLILVATKAGGIAFALFLLAAAICGTAFVLGLVALSGPLRTIWLVVGGAIMLIGVGSSLRSWRSLTAITGHAVRIHESFEKLVENLSTAKELRSLNEVDIQKMGVVKQARFTRKIRKTVQGSLGEFQDLSSAFASVSAFPSVVFAAAVAIMSSAVFGAVFLAILLL